MRGAADRDTGFAKGTIAVVCLGSGRRFAMRKHTLVFFDETAVSGSRTRSLTIVVYVKETITEMRKSRPHKSRYHPNRV
jgi:hypothetical protein